MVIWNLNPAWSTIFFSKRIWTKSTMPQRSPVMVFRCDKRPKLLCVSSLEMHTSFPPLWMAFLCELPFSPISMCSLYCKVTPLSTLHPQPLFSPTPWEDECFFCLFLALLHSVTCSFQYHTMDRGWQRAEQSPPFPFTKNPPSQDPRANPELPLMGLSTKVAPR